jgi:pimeloyl-ACP methyl ester carboxylesterase
MGIEVTGLATTNSPPTDHRFGMDLEVRPLAYGPRVEVVRTHGVELAYDRAGTGPPIVLVHGAASDSRSWRPQLDHLADELTVVAWDEPGAGRSSDLPAGFGLAGFADCLAALIDDVGLGPAHVGGLSWGGTVALELYRRHPDSVATLILADTYAGWAGSLPPDEVAARVATVRAALAAPALEMESALPGLFAAAPRAEVARLVEAMTADVRPQSLTALATVMGAADLSDVLPTIAVPALLVWGERDVRSPLRVAREFEAAIPDAALVVIPDCGHFSNLERPDEFNRAVREFCREQPDRPG